MAKLHFYYSTMNAGKSTHLLQANHNYQSDGHQTMLLKPAIDDRMGETIIGSRIGISAEAHPVAIDDDVFELVRNQNEKSRLTAVFVDESQFFNKKQVLQLARVADELNIAVLAYGLKNNFMGELFEGSKVLLELADNLREIKTTCHCGSKATMVLKYDQNGDVLRGGKEVDIGAEEKYVAVCRKHFMDGDIGNTARKNLITNDKVLIEKIATLFSKSLSIKFNDAINLIVSDKEELKTLKEKILSDLDLEVVELKGVCLTMPSTLSKKMIEKNVKELELLKEKIKEL